LFTLLSADTVQNEELPLILKEAKNNTFEHYTPNYLALFGLSFPAKSLSGAKNSTVEFVQLPL
jgi:hypothetical protein